MGERFERIYMLPENLYSVGAPVIISAGVLLKDTENGNILAQLRIKNISAKPVKVAKVKIIPLDTVGKPLNEAVYHEYLDLNAPRDAEFGQKKAICIPDSSTRSFDVNVTEIVFADHSIWKVGDKKWSALPESVSIEKALGSQELVRQYRIHYGQTARVQPVKNGEIWICACGTVNRDDEKACHICGNKADALFSADLKGLNSEAEERVEQEQEVARKKRKRVIIAALLALIVIVGTAITVTVISKQSKAKNADNLVTEYLANRDYYSALCVYAEINDEDGVETILDKMGIPTSGKIAIGRNQMICALNGEWFRTYDGTTGKEIYGISGVRSNEFDSFCKSALKGSPVEYSFDFS